MKIKNLLSHITIKRALICLFVAIVPASLFAQIKLDREEVIDFCLGSLIYIAKERVPQESEIADIRLTNDAVVYEYNVADQELFNLLKTRAHEVKVNALTAYLTNRDMLSPMALLCIESSRSLIHRYRYSSAQKDNGIFDVVILPDEFKELYGISEVSPSYRFDRISKYLEVVNRFMDNQSPVSLESDKLRLTIASKGPLPDIDSDFSRMDLFRSTLGTSLETLDTHSYLPALCLYLETGLEYYIETNDGDHLSLSADYLELADLFVKERADLADNVSVSSLSDRDGLEKPTFRGGDANEFSKWVNSQLNYPEFAKEHGVQGRITLRFTINTDGSVSNVMVLNKDCNLFIQEKASRKRSKAKDRFITDEQKLERASEALAKEAVRVVSSSPNWTPGSENGKPIKVTYTFPVIFQLR